MKSESQDAPDAVFEEPGVQELKISNSLSKNCVRGVLGLRILNRLFKNCVRGVLRNKF